MIQLGSRYPCASSVAARPWRRTCCFRVEKSGVAGGEEVLHVTKISQKWIEMELCCDTEFSDHSKNTWRFHEVSRGLGVPPVIILFLKWNSPGKPSILGYPIYGKLHLGRASPFLRGNSSGSSFMTEYQRLDARPVAVALLEIATVSTC